MQLIFNTLATKIVAISAIALLFGNAEVSAQADLAYESKLVRLDIKSPKIDIQLTPDIKAGNVTDKRWKPKKWVEVEIEFDGKKAPAKAGEVSTPIVDQLEFRYFVALSAKDPMTKKNYLLTGTVVHVNIEEKEKAFSVMYVSPSALKAYYPNEVSKSDVEAVGVEVRYNNELCGWATTTASNWWLQSDKFVEVKDLLLKKSKTPFAPLWADFHAEEKVE